MATLHRTIELTSAPEDAWSKLADVGAVNKIMPFLGDVTVDGDVRTCALGDGKLEELIVSVDHDRQRLVYAFLNSPFGFTQHSAAMHVLPTDNGCTIDWTHDFKPDEAAPALAEAVDGAAAALRQTIG
jgi:hypothetical protein